MPKEIPLCQTSIKDDVRTLIQAQVPRDERVYKLPKDIAFDVAYQVEDTLYEKITDDDRLANAIFFGKGRSISAVFKKAKTEIANLFIAAEAEAEDIIENNSSKEAAKLIGRKQKSLQVKVRQMMMTYGDKMVEKADLEIATWQKVRKDRTRYVRQGIVKVSLSTIGVASSAVGTGFAAASGGWALGVGIYALAKSLINLGKTVVKYARDTEAAEAVVRSDLKALEESYEDASVAEVTGKELAIALMDQLFAVEGASISKVESNLGIFSGKLAGLRKKSSAFGTQVNKLVDSQVAVLAAVKAERARLKKKKVPLSTKLLSLQEKLESLEEATAAQIKATEALYKRVDAALKRERRYNVTISALKQKKPEWVQYAEKALVLVDVGLDVSTIGGQVSDIVLISANIATAVGDIMNDEL